MPRSPSKSIRPFISRSISWLLIGAVALLLHARLTTAEENGTKERDSDTQRQPLDLGPETRDPPPAAKRGYELLRTKPYLPPDFDQDVFDNLWKTWPEPLRSQAREASPLARRHMAFARYGLIEDPRGDETGPAFGYVDDGRDGWVMNCFTCHAGKVAGRVVPGAPNTHLALQTLVEEVRSTKIRMLKRLTHLDVGSLTIPFGTTIGTTNSVVFGIALGALRDNDLRVNRSLSSPKLVHHDMDAPPWWNVHKKSRLYIDGFAPKNHRVLMQFMLVPENRAETLRGWESDFSDILAYLESLRPPKYPWPVNSDLAITGRKLFRQQCSRCHGTYGKEASYPERLVPWEEVRTDVVRLEALNGNHRRWLAESWMSHYGQDEVVLDPGGYVAPPLDGIWASAPYLHNGSVPTLWHLLHPGERPVVWKRTADDYDREKVGLRIEEFANVPTNVRGRAERRHYFDTRKFSKSATGHRFPDELSGDEKRAVLEYLKTL